MSRERQSVLIIEWPVNRDVGHTAVVLANSRAIYLGEKLLYPIKVIIAYFSPCYKQGTDAPMFLYFWVSAVLRQAFPDVALPDINDDRLRE